MYNTSQVIWLFRYRWEKLQTADVWQIFEVCNCTRPCCGNSFNRSFSNSRMCLCVHACMHVCMYFMYNNMRPKRYICPHYLTFTGRHYRTPTISHRISHEKYHPTTHIKTNTTTVITMTMACTGPRQQPSQEKLPQNWPQKEKQKDNKWSIAGSERWKGWC